MFLELWERHPARELALEVFFSDADGSFATTRYRPHVPPEVEAWFQAAARRRLAPVADAESEVRRRRAMSVVEFGESVQHLYFSDLSRAVRFYTSSLGFAVSEQHPRRREAGVSAATVVRRGLATLWLYAAIPELAFPKAADFLVSDVDELYAELTAAGVSPIGSPQYEDTDEYGGREYGFSLLDPERNPLKFWRHGESTAEPGATPDCGGV
jgi:catechol 2,3-dioxygenase-like lactoylglutathione lyase family enzyme